MFGKWFDMVSKYLIFTYIFMYLYYKQLLPSLFRYLFTGEELLIVIITLEMLNFTVECIQ